VLGFHRGGIQDVVKVLVSEEEGINLNFAPPKPCAYAIRCIHEDVAAGQGEQVAVRGGDTAGISRDFRHGEGERRESVGHFNPEKAKS
jgi:hypothetical protein